MSDIKLAMRGDKEVVLINDFLINYRLSKLTNKLNKELKSKGKRVKILVSVLIEDGEV